MLVCLYMYVFVCTCLCLDMFLGRIEELVTYFGFKITGDCEPLDRHSVGKKFQKTFWKSIKHFKLLSHIPSSDNPVSLKS